MMFGINRLKVCVLGLALGIALVEQLHGREPVVQQRLGGGVAKGTVRHGRAEPVVGGENGAHRPFAGSIVRPASSSAARIAAALSSAASLSL